MIVIEWDKYTRECASVEEVHKVIEIEKLNLQDVSMKFRVKIPGIAWEGVLQDVVGSGGKVL